MRISNVLAERKQFGIYSDAAGYWGVNTTFEKDGSINSMVGPYASKPGPFSPLVERDGAPRYTPAQAERKHRTGLMI